MMIRGFSMLAAFALVLTCLVASAPAGADELPDGRVYERVSSLAPYGAEVYAPYEAISNYIASVTELPFEASANGERVVYVGAPTVGGNELAGEFGGNEYLATRSPGGGWVQSDISPFEAPTGVYQAFSKGLTVGFLDALEPLSAQAPGFGEKLTSEELHYQANYDVLYSTDLGGGEYAPFFTVTPPFRSRSSFATANLFKFYHAGVKGNVGGRQSRALLFAGASADSSHVLFLANDALTGASEGRPAAEGGAGATFEKENNLYETVDGRLRLVNVLPDGTTQANATFGAQVGGIGNRIESSEVQFSRVISSDGSRIFWTDLATGHIYVRENGVATAEVSSAGTYQTASSDGSVVFYTNGDLYKDEVENGHTTDLTPGVPVERVLGASEDGRYVYYVTDSGELKLWHDGVTTSIAASNVERAQVTPDGHSVVLEGGKEDKSPDAYGRISVYDADTGTLYCASCSSVGTGGFLPVNIAPSVNETRWITADGGRVFFMTESALVPQDTNANNDAYEWERPGVGSCPPGGTEGCLYLLSGGTNRDQSFFLDSSESGDDVFIDTRAKLVGSDEDDLFDVYDVRVDGYVPPAPPACTGSGCQGLPGAPPIFATPSSVTFEGVGNFATSPQKNGSVSKAKQKKPPRKKKKSRRKKKGSKAKGSARKAAARKHSGAKGVRS